mgnify:CR=1 FL=1
MTYEMVKVNTPKGWLGNSADRVAREMATEKKILKRNVTRYAEYRLKTEVTQLSL